MMVGQTQASVYFASLVWPFWIFAAVFPVVTLAHFLSCDRDTGILATAGTQSRSLAHASASQTVLVIHDSSFTTFTWALSR